MKNDTLKNLSLAVGMLVVIFGGIAWLTDTNSRAHANGAKISKMDSRIIAIDQKLHKILGMLEVMADQKSK